MLQEFRTTLPAIVRSPCIVPLTTDMRVLIMGMCVVIRIPHIPCLRFTRIARITRDGTFTRGIATDTQRRWL